MIEIIRCDTQTFIERNGQKLYCPGIVGSFCGSWCPFFDHRPKQLGQPESVSLRCRTKEITLFEGEES